MVSSWTKEGEFANTVAHECGETCTDEPLELFVTGIRNKRFPPAQNNWDGEERDGDKDGEQTECGVQESGKALCDAHLFNILAPKAEIQLGGSLNGSNGPSGTLFEMSSVILRDSTVLQRLVNVRSFPSSSQHEC